MTNANISPSPQRLEHFLWLKDPAFTLQGWGGSIKEIEETLGRVVVSLVVLPRATHQGRATVMGDIVLEKYAIVDGKVQFLEMIEPDPLVITQDKEPREFGVLVSPGHRVLSQSEYQQDRRYNAAYRPFLVVHPSPVTKGALGETHRKIADLLTKANIPPSAQRLEHFIWLKDPSFTLHAWNGTVKEVEEIPGGVAVLLAVIPTVRHQGRATAVGDLVLEKYAIVNGQVQFLELTEPYPPTEKPGFAQ